MGAEAGALARAVAVLGDGAEVVLAARLADLEPAVAELTADRLAGGQILAPVRPLEFFHPLIGVAIRDDIAPGARRVAHRRAAALVERDGQGSLARVAAHLLACGPAGDPWVVQRLADAAHVSLERGAAEVAVDYVRRALAEPPAPSERSSLLLLLGTAEWRAGQPDATAHLEQALAAAGEDHGAQIAACVQLALAYALSDSADRAVEVTARALAAVADAHAAAAASERLGAIEALPPMDTAGLALAFDATAATVGMLDERTAPAALRRAEELRGRLDALADPPVYLFGTLAYYAARMNRAAEAEELAKRALACEPYPPSFSLCTVLIITLILV
jgi:hypothetical protein